jgi:hypothetical protein
LLEAGLLAGLLLLSNGALAATDAAAMLVTAWTARFDRALLRIAGFLGLSLRR